MSRALVESNLINLLAFLRNLVHDDDVPESACEEIRSIQDELETLLTNGERLVEDGSVTREAAYTLIVDLVTAANLLVVSRQIHHLPPRVATAVGAFHDFLADTVCDVAAWVELHATDPTLQERALQMKAQLDAMSSQAMQTGRATGAHRRVTGSMVSGQRPGT